MDNVACFMLGTMLHLQIKEGKEAMMTSTFQKDISDTETCMKRQIMAKKWCGQLTSNEIYFAESCFS